MFHASGKPESNGMVEAFVKTFKHDCVRISPIPNANGALALIDGGMEDYNTAHLLFRLGYRSPREYIFLPIHRVSGLTGSTQGAEYYDVTFRARHPAGSRRAQITQTSQTLVWCWTVRKPPL